MDLEQKRQGLSSVTAPTASDMDRCKTTMGAVQLKQACLAKAGQCFTQATGMPFLSKPLCSIFKNHGMITTEFQELLDSTFQPLEECDPYAKKLLQALQKPPGITPIPQRTLIDYTNAWNKAREMTSSSISQVHFGHYMVGMFNPNIAIMNATVADIPMLTGYAPARWKNGLNVMLQKQVGNINVEKYKLSSYSKQILI